MEMPSPFDKRLPEPGNNRWEDDFSVHMEEEDVPGPPCRVCHETRYERLSNERTFRCSSCGEQTSSEVFLAGGAGRGELWDQEAEEPDEAWQVEAETLPDKPYVHLFLKTQWAENLTAQVAGPVRITLGRENFAKLKELWEQGDRAVNDLQPREGETFDEFVRRGDQQNVPDVSEVEFPNIGHRLRPHYLHEETRSALLIQPSLQSNEDPVQPSTPPVFLPLALQKIVWQLSHADYLYIEPDELPHTRLRDRPVIETRVSVETGGELTFQFKIPDPETGALWIESKPLPPALRTHLTFRLGEAAHIAKTVGELGSAAQEMSRKMGHWLLGTLAHLSPDQTRQLHPRDLSPFLSLPDPELRGQAIRVLGKLEKTEDDNQEAS